MAGAAAAEPSDWQPIETPHEVRLAAVPEPVSPVAPPRMPDRLVDRMKPYALTIYGGQSITSDFTSIFYSPHRADFENTYLATLALSARVASLTDHLALELEAAVGRRFGDAELWEFHTALFLRWDDFPWNDTVYTTVGLGLFGPSYATEISETELDKSGNDKGSKLLNYFAPEITISPPDNRDLALIVRLHHRSGVFGLFNGVSGGSNFLVFGLRHRF